MSHPKSSALADKARKEAVIRILVGLLRKKNGAGTPPKK